MLAIKWWANVTPEVNLRSLMNWWSVLVRGSSQICKPRKDMTRSHGVWMAPQKGLMPSKILINKKFFYCGIFGRVRTSLHIRHTPYMLVHAHNKGLLLRSALVALYKNALWLEPERPITVSLTLTTTHFVALTIFQGLLSPCLEVKLYLNSFLDRN